MSKHIAVIGAGIVGISAAVALQRRGFAVSLIDRKEPARETSYGNTGVITRYAITPANDPSIWKVLPTYLRNDHPAMRYRPTYVAANLAWFIRFLAGATAANTAPRSKALDVLLDLSCRLHREWIIEAGSSERFRDNGTLKLWRNESNRAKVEASHRAMAKIGLDAPVLDRQDISALEPDIAPIFALGLFNKHNASVNNPGKVGSAYAAMFAAHGGKIIQDECRRLEQCDGEAWKIHLTTATITVDAVVLALGPWSADVLKTLGYNVPLAFERGYHQEFRSPKDRKLSRPIYDCDNYYLMTPVENGIRVTTGVEFAHRDAPSNYSQRDAVVPRAREIIPFGEPIAEPWRGSRPTLPDCLPVIGEAPRHKNLWLGFGHQHIGFTTGPATGHILAGMIAKQDPPFNVSAFRPERYL